MELYDDLDITSSDINHYRSIQVTKSCIAREQEPSPTTTPVDLGDRKRKRTINSPQPSQSNVYPKPAYRDGRTSGKALAGTQGRRRGAVWRVAVW